MKKRTSRKFKQSCDLIPGGRNIAAAGVPSKKMDRKSIVNVYNRFYRDQLAELYKAVHGKG